MLNWRIVTVTTFVISVSILLVRATPPLPRHTTNESSNQNNCNDAADETNQQYSSATIDVPHTTTDKSQSSGQSKTANDESNPVIVRVLRDIEIHKGAWDYISVVATLLVAIGTLIIAGVAFVQAKAALKSA